MLNAVFENIGISSLHKVSVHSDNERSSAEDADDELSDTGFNIVLINRPKMVSLNSKVN